MAGNFVIFRQDRGLVEMGKSISQGRTISSMDVIRKSINQRRVIAFPFFSGVSLAQIRSCRSDLILKKISQIRTIKREIRATIIKVEWVE